MGAEEVVGVVDVVVVVVVVAVAVAVVVVVVDDEEIMLEECKVLMELVEAVVLEAGMGAECILDMLEELDAGDVELNFVV